MKLILFICANLFVATPAFAIECADLKPAPPVNTNTSFVGKLDASLDGFFAKLAAVGTTAEGNYSTVSNNVLKEFPSADRLYMWERVLFLQCQMLSSAGDVDNRTKLQMIGDLYSKFGSPPPETGNAMSITGDHNIMQNGIQNSVNK
ncbi:hypothetical protein [Rhizobium leguminosarum]|uniref:Uncharacterized protein n=1 Tax=Rhizobium leguminosarum TaxID=384 RepID=A0A7K3VJU0_RHILE|nr:hypothetical protein [Rhizobium leguminosarum]NEK17470.1 hypothetical protein [Rhizobium leguminosarum]